MLNMAVSQNPLNHMEKEHDKLLDREAKDIFFKWCRERIGVSDIIDSNETGNAHYVMLYL